MKEERSDHEQPAGEEYWRGKAFAFFTNTSCECFPCHDGIAPEDFNCLFCYCPLYMLGNQCRGGFTYTDGGIKDCSGCVIPHRRDNYGYITERFNEIVLTMQGPGDQRPAGDQSRAAADEKS
jgi:Zn-finger protein